MDMGRSSTIQEATFNLQLVSDVFIFYTYIENFLPDLQVSLIQNKLYTYFQLIVGWSCRSSTPDSGKEAFGLFRKAERLRAVTQHKCTKASTGDPPFGLVKR